jgi:hypothetical protein
MNIDEIDKKQPKTHRNIHASLWIFKVSRKTKQKQKPRDFCQMFVISWKKLGRWERKPYPRVWIKKSREKL